MPDTTAVFIENKTASGKSGRTAGGRLPQNPSNRKRWINRHPNSSIATARTARRQTGALKKTTSTRRIAAAGARPGATAAMADSAAAEASEAAGDGGNLINSLTFNWDPSKTQA